MNVPSALMAVAAGASCLACSYSRAGDMRRLHTPQQVTRWVRRLSAASTDELVEAILCRARRLPADDIDILTTRFGRMLKRVADPSGPDAYAVTVVYSALLSTYSP